VPTTPWLRGGSTTGSIRGSARQLLRRELAVIVQPYNSLAYIPAWIMREAAAHYTLSEETYFLSISQVPCARRSMRFWAFPSPNSHESPPTIVNHVLP
jgi:hypothetical protein